MAKKVDKQNLYLAIVGIVGVVAVVILILNFTGGKQAVAGEASSSQFTCPACLKDYNIGAYALTAGGGNGAFKVNGNHFNLSRGSSNTLATGEIVTLGSALIQNYAGGLSGVEFKFTNACPNDYKIKAYRVNFNNPSGQFEINGEQFTLNIGQSKILIDGSKVILLGLLSHPYAYAGSGENGPIFELIC